MAKFLKEGLEDNLYKVLIIHYADLLKYIAGTYFKWNGIKDEAGRAILQWIGTDVVRSRNPDYWADFVVDFLKLFDDEWDYAIIPDCRFPNEIDKPKECFDVTHIRVRRGAFKSPLTEEQQNHPSETSLDNVVPDIKVANNSDLSALRELCLKLVHDF